MVGVVGEGRFLTNHEFEIKNNIYFQQFQKYVNIRCYHTPLFLDITLYIYKYTRVTMRVAVVGRRYI
jgi:hypothetical protein